MINTCMCVGASLCVSLHVGVRACSRSTFGPVVTHVVLGGCTLITSDTMARLRGHALPFIKQAMQRNEGFRGDCSATK